MAVRLDFRNVVLMMTTYNAGVQEKDNAKSISFTKRDKNSTAMHIDLEIKRIFALEFCNRLDSIIWFNGLTPEVIAQLVKLVDKFIVDLQTQLDEKGVSIEISDAGRQWFCTEGHILYDKAMMRKRASQADDKSDPG